MIFTFLVSGLVANAQDSWDWDDCVDWFRYEGIEILCTYAHPAWDMEDFTITQTSPDIIVTVEFDGLMFHHTNVYKIVRRNYNGRPYFYDIKILRENPLSPSFVTWDGLLPKFHGLAYESEDFYKLYDNVRDFESLSLAKKAAFGLTMEFIAKQR